MDAPPDVGSDAAIDASAAEVGTDSGSDAFDASIDADDSGGTVDPILNGPCSTPGAIHCNGHAQQLRPVAASPVVDLEAGGVLAGTWSPIDGRLWLIEDTGSGSNRRERFVRVRLGSGAAEVFGSWPRVGLFDRHWLAVDRDASMPTPA